MKDSDGQTQTFSIWFAYACYAKTRGEVYYNGVCILEFMFFYAFELYLFYVQISLFLSVAVPFLCWTLVAEMSSKNL
jgi:hypothetical protein